MRDYIGEIKWSGNDFLNNKNSLNEEIISKNLKLTYEVNSEDFQCFTYKNYSIVIDGEIYSNTKEVIINSKKFLTDNINKIEYNISNFLQELNGSFNLLIYNHFNNELNIINDRFATRPLYYYKDSERFIFSNKMSNIPKYHRSNLWEINYDTVREFFKLQMIMGEKTFINSIHSIEDATFSKISKNKSETLKYWFFKHKENKGDKRKNYKDEIADLISEIISYKTSGTQTYGILMSGGLDSRAILAADKEKKIAQVFTLGDSFNYECQIARKVAESHGSNFNYIERDRNYYYDILDESIRIGDGMYNYTNGHFIGCMKELSQKSDIIFNGSLIEQLWQGTKFFNPKIKILGKEIALPFLIKENKKIDTVDYLKENFPKQVKYGHSIFKNKNLTNEVIRNSFKNKLVKNFQTTKVPLQEAVDYLACDSYGRYSSHLNQLCINERMIYRTVYDNRLIDKLLEVPINKRSSGKLLKQIVNSLDKNLADIPLANSGKKLKSNFFVHWFYEKLNGFKNFYFKADSYKTKNSSWPDYSILLRDNKKLLNRIEDIIYDENIIDDNIFDKDYIVELYKNHVKNNENNERILFLLLTYGEWKKSMNSYLND